ncbi:TPA: ATP-binding cassette domain-containing protein [Candidatus Woesearchaeota archaeon]|nr:ATP-binding cassette domain-containing protein [Candidatus Woesearchaeota archaeon]
MDHVIKVQNLSKRFKIKQKGKGVSGSIKSFFAPEYKLVTAVNNISFSVKQGEIVGFIGPNGAGKSTAIKMMTGILYPDQGSISVLGYDPQQQRQELAYHIGTVFGQKPQLWYHLPPIDSFNLFAAIYDLPKSEYEKRLNLLVRLFEVEDILQQPVRKLSLGQRMRCEMMASLLHKPKIIFLDEPTIGMDILVRKKIRELIKELNEKEKTTIILTSHDLEDVEQVCERIVIINNGKIIYDGPTVKLREQYLHWKRIKIIFAKKTNELKLGLRYCTVLNKGNDEFEINVDTRHERVQKVIERIMSLQAVEDITIIDPPIEEIIQELFQKRHYGTRKI